MPRRRQSVFVTDRDNKELYIRPKSAGIELLCLICDGVSLTFFGEKDGPYLTVEQAIEWQEKESLYSAGKWLAMRQNNIRVMKEALARFKRGEAKCNDV